MSEHNYSDATRARVTCDVVVVGSGAAGSAAALGAHEAGATVLILDKDDASEAGGNTRVSGGAWFHHDDPDGIAVYLRALCGERPVPDEIVRVWAEGTGCISDWLTSLGADVREIGNYSAEYPELPGSDSYGGYRGIGGVMGRFALFDFLRRAVAEAGIEIRHNSCVIELLTESGRVTGVRCADGSVVVARGGVVLATGGFEADTELVREHLGMDGARVWGSRAGTGDGLRLALKAGADLWHMDNMMAVDGITPTGSEQGFFVGPLGADACVWIDGQGRRFIDETAPSGHGQALVDGEYVRKPHRAMTVVFDETRRAAGPLSPDASLLPVGWRVLMEGYEWSADNQIEIESGWITRADTLAELAGLMGLPADALTATVERYNAVSIEGLPDEFGRPSDACPPLATPPFYAYGTSPMLGWTNGGPRRDERARVLTRSGQPVDGLYAAGAVSSTYSWLKDGGFHIADALVFGRIAGTEAAANARGIVEAARSESMDARS